MTFDEVVEHIVEEQPEMFQRGNIKFVRRRNGEYLVALLDYDAQAKVVGEEMLVVFCKASKNGISGALTRIIKAGGML